MHDTASFLRSLSLFVVAGICEIVGGWLMWKWLRDGKPGWWGAAGAVIPRRDEAASAPLQRRTLAVAAKRILMAPQKRILMAPQCRFLAELCGVMSMRCIQDGELAE